MRIPLFDADADEFDERLLAWLRTLDEGALARLLANRPDALQPPWPRRLDDLARRLDSQVSTVLALRQASLPALQVIRAAQLCSALEDGAPPTATAVSDRLGVSGVELTAVLEPLSEIALAWLDETGRVHLPEGLHGDGYAIYQLGPPIRAGLEDTNADELKRLAARLGLGGSGRKQQVIDRLLAFFRDGDNVRALVDGAPNEARELILDAAWHGPEVDADVSYVFSRYRGGSSNHESAVEWVLHRGLVCPDYDGVGYLPLEVGLALRGSAYRLPFAPEPPAVTTTRVGADNVAAECSAAALRLIDRTLTTVGAAATEPIPLLKSGRVGVRAIKAIAKSADASVDEIRLALELASAASLLAPVEPPPASPRKGRGRSRRPQPPPPPEGLVPTEEFARWRDASSALRLRILVSTWWTLQQTPLADEKPVHAVLGNEPSAAFADIRQRTVELLTERAEGVGVTGGLVDLVGWRSPMLTDDLVEPLVTASIAEATLLGVTASGAAGELGRALVAGSAAVDDPALVKATDALVAGARTSALFGSDLTAIVTGPVDAELAGLLDRMATRESQGSASSWRFSPDSVRRAFDNGAAAADVLDQLGSIAEGTLPQPLVYLINDVARRHGELGVLDVRCVVVAENPTLLTEIAAHRKLAELGLRELAPTVLAAGSTAQETLAALRKAGYAPVARHSDGSIVVTSEKMAPAAPEMREPTTSTRTHEPDPVEHAARLLRQSRSSAKRIGRGALVNALDHKYGERFPPNWTQFAWQLEAGFGAQIDYREPSGETRRIQISHPELNGDAIDVWCAQDGDYRQLDLSRITPVGFEGDLW